MVELTGPVTMQNAPAVLAAALAAVASGEREFSLARLEGSDSSALALLLELTRHASAAGSAPRFTNVPPVLASFAALYGLDTIIPDLHA